MEIFVKLASAEFEKLRGGTPRDSNASVVIERATRIEHAVEGVLFEGYTVACDETEAESLLKIARQCCPETVPKIEEAIRIAESQSGRR